MAASSNGQEDIDLERMRESEEDSSEDEAAKPQDWDDWGDEDNEDSSSSSFLCLFCEAKYTTCASLFDHCSSAHLFNFDAVRKALSLDFYGSVKLINYVRARVSECRCWSCPFKGLSNQDLLHHLHEPHSMEDIKCILDGDEYLKPFLLEDSLLYSFDEDKEEDDHLSVSVDEEELVEELQVISSVAELPIYDFASTNEPGKEDGWKEIASTSNSNVGMDYSSNLKNNVSGPSFSPEVLGNGLDLKVPGCSSNGKREAELVRDGFKKHIANHIRTVNENYFGAYSSFGIHREMLSDKVRMDAYGRAILRNPSLFDGAVVMDVGCGTGILSLFAAQAGASRVIAVEASEKMAGIATKIAEDNSLRYNEKRDGCDKGRNGVVKVVCGMVEQLHKATQIQPHSVDVLLSEWMGYCLLYESMLSSVLYARDRWLRPGGAILPDTATIFVAGFGKGATSIPFWEDVYGFDMSCIGKEILEDAARNPVVDIVNDRDLVTKSVVLQTFDLVSMKADDVDFTATVQLEPKSAGQMNVPGEPTWCYGVVLWFETGFTSRFCKDFPAVLSTSPYTPGTHWAQTILTLREPIAISSKRPPLPPTPVAPAAGTAACPAEKIQLRISIARAPEHRSIDISLEAVCISAGGQSRSWPVQIFNLQ